MQMPKTKPASLPIDGAIQSTIEAKTIISIIFQ
jgi:hypothetical protein